MDASDKKAVEDAVWAWAEEGVGEKLVSLNDELTNLRKDMVSLKETEDIKSIKSNKNREIKLIEEIERLEKIQKDKGKKRKKVNMSKSPASTGNFSRIEELKLAPKLRKEEASHIAAVRARAAEWAAEAEAARIAEERKAAHIAAVRARIAVEREAAEREANEKEDARIANFQRRLHSIPTEREYAGREAARIVDKREAAGAWAMVSNRQKKIARIPYTGLTFRCLLNTRDKLYGMVMVTINKRTNKITIKQNEAITDVIKEQMEEDRGDNIGYFSDLGFLDVEEDGKIIKLDFEIGERTRVSINNQGGMEEIHIEGLMGGAVINKTIILNNFFPSNLAEGHLWPRNGGTEGEDDESSWAEITLAHIMNKYERDLEGLPGAQVALLAVVREASLFLDAMKPMQLKNEDILLIKDYIDGQL
jgi:hypothetical protein